MKKEIRASLCPLQPDVEEEGEEGDKGSRRTYGLCRALRA